MIEFVFMLTHHDRTVDDPLSVQEELRGTGLRYVGFKDIGPPVPVLRDVCVKAQDDGLEVMLEVVSTSRDDELRSVAAAAEIGVDWVLGGTHPVDGCRVLAGSGARYCPFPGRVSGLDLLAYRHPTADAAALTRAVVQAASGPVIAAGSVASVAQIEALAAAGAWGFTIGGAIFEGRLPGGPSVAGQVREVLRAASQAA